MSYRRAGIVRTGQPGGRLSGQARSESFTTTSSDLTDAVLITGAGRRVGLHLAERTLGRGRPVIAHYRTWTEGAARLQARGALRVAGDLATEAGVDHLIASVRGTASSLRAIVHNASEFAATSREVGEALGQFDLFYAIHMRSPFTLDLAFTDLYRIRMIEAAESRP